MSSEDLENLSLDEHPTVSFDFFSFPYGTQCSIFEKLNFDKRTVFEKCSKRTSTFCDQHGHLPSILVMERVKWEQREDPRVGLNNHIFQSFQQPQGQQQEDDPPLLNWKRCYWNMNRQRGHFFGNRAIRIQVDRVKSFVMDTDFFVIDCLYAKNQIICDFIMKKVIHLRRLRIDLALPLIDDYVLNNLLKHFPIVGLEIKLARGQRTFPYKTESIHTVLINNAKSLKAQELFGIKAAHLVDARDVSITAMDICDLVEDLIAKRRPLFNRYFTSFNEKFHPEEIKTAFLSLGDVCRFVEDYRWVITRPEEELPFLELFLGQYSGSLMVCVTDVAVRTPVELSLPENVPEPVSEGPVVPEEVTVPVVETVTEDQIPAKTTKKGLAKGFKQLKARFFKQRSFPDSRSMNSS